MTVHARGSVSRWKSIQRALIHLRLPFSLVLTPLFLWGVYLARPGPIAWGHVLAAYLIIHVLLYGGMNAFNSYYDRDDGLIGALLDPPPIGRTVLISRFAPGWPLAETPTTAERMAIYQREAVHLGVSAAARALAPPQLPDAAAGVTHLIVVSCTGFFAPGLDLAIAQRLGLRPTVQRTLVGFMGCAAAFNGLRLAAQIVTGQPDAQVLVVCVELCTLHLQPGSDRITLTVASLFADGAAACLVGAAGPSGDLLRLNRLHTQVLPDTTGAMAWQIGDHGFVMHLSPDVPRHVGTLAQSALSTLLDGQPTPTFWAIHPGGRAIVDRLADLLQLAPAQMAASYSILRRYGNMSSPTILFVLRELLEQLRTADRPASGVAAAFGPGLVTEMAHLTYVPPVAPRPIAVRQPKLTEAPIYVA